MEKGARKASVVCASDQRLALFFFVLASRFRHFAPHEPFGPHPSINRTKSDIECLYVWYVLSFVFILLNNTPSLFL